MHWQNFLNNTMKSFSNLSKEIPETFKGFETMGKEAKKNGALDEKTKEEKAPKKRIKLSADNKTPPIHSPNLFSR